jgi:phosphoglucosamine mutase
MGKLFGTDGIRGMANQYPIIAELAMDLGRALVFTFANGKPDTNIIVGKDPRISGDMLESALCAGICSMGANAVTVGVLPTPAVAFLVNQANADAGAVISASHNPFHDNGLKIFNKNGFKLSDDVEDKIETLMNAGSTWKLSETIRQTGRVQTWPDADHQYLDFLKNSLPNHFSLNGIKIVLDCSNGATYQVAPALFSSLGANVETIFANPDGLNINKNCGSQQTQALREKVVQVQADIGLAFDGDGDRLVAVDEKGNEVRGDKIMLICATFLKENNQLKHNLLVSTVMSNLGLTRALRQRGILHQTTKVGDRYVFEMMKKTGAVVGGEDSGHIIFADDHTTGDGLLAALKLLEALQYYNRPLSELAGQMNIFPQVLLNIKVKKKPDISTLPKVMEKIESVEKCLVDQGRVLVRYSGTQNLCRVMVEGPVAKETDTYCRSIADVVRESIGSD